MNNGCQSNNCSCGIQEILETIAVLQSTVNNIEADKTCGRKFLGNETCGKVCNTRPITLYGCNGTVYSFPTDENATPLDSDVELSCVLRVEKVDGCTCVCRVLERKNCSDDRYAATDSYVSINLACVCCCRCLPDTYVDLCS